MVEAEKKSFTLIDARTKEEYQEAHIVGAISIPENKFEDSLSLLPKDRGSQLIFYCNGVKCGKGKKAAKKAATLGYTNILIYGDGFPVWEEKGLKIVPGPDYAKKIETTKMKPSELNKLMQSGDKGFVVVDVRDESEYKEGHIPGAISLPLETFASRSEVLPKERKIIVYCNSGGRSYNAYRKLMKLAYPSIYQTIFDEWKQAGLPVEKYELHRLTKGNEMQIDTRRKGCPQPVMMTEEALSKITEGIINVLVDNEESALNVAGYATQHGMFTETTREGRDWKVKVVKGYACKPGAQPEVANAKPAQKKKTLLIIIGTDSLGKDEDLGKKLIKGLFDTMKVYKQLPHTIFFLNAGVKSTTVNDETVAVLKEIADLGVEIYSCGTCLKHYNLESELKVGNRGTTNHIVEGMQDFDKVVWV